MTRSSVSFVLLALLSAAPAAAQSVELPAASPRGTVTQQVGVVRVTVDYSSPGVKERTVWGELVPYDTLWRTGANSATTFETTGDLIVDGKAVPAGKYSVFSIPGKTSWTLILNQDAEQGGTSEYSEAKDQVRLQVAPVEAPPRERMTFLFSDTDEDSTRLDLEWAGVRISVPIEVDTGTMVTSNIEAYAKNAGRQLANAGRYKAEHGDLPGALTLIDASLAIEPTWYNTWLKADILHKQDEHKQAYQLAQKAQEMGAAAGEAFFWKDRVEKALAEWKKK